MLRFIGKFEDLKKLGFIEDFFQTYWFYPKMERMHTLIINIDTREIECSYKEDLSIIEGMYEEI